MVYADRLMRLLAEEVIPRLNARIAKKPRIALV